MSLIMVGSNLVLTVPIFWLVGLLVLAIVFKAVFKR
jgi:hypothetical protein